MSSQSGSAHVGPCALRHSQKASWKEWRRERGDGRGGCECEVDGFSRGSCGRRGQSGLHPVWLDTAVDRLEASAGWREGGADSIGFAIGVAATAGGGVHVRTTIVTSTKAW